MDRTYNVRSDSVLLSKFDVISKHCGFDFIQKMTAGTDTVKHKIL